jgi:hypothetical protein
MTVRHEGLVHSQTSIGSSYFHVTFYTNAAVQCHEPPL